LSQIRISDPGFPAEVMIPDPGPVENGVAEYRFRTRPPRNPTRVNSASRFGTG